MLSYWLSPALALVLACVGLLHLMWAMRVHFPYASEQSLARAVVGRRGITKMPSPTACLIVSILLFGAAAWALLLGGYVALPFSKWLTAPIGLVIGAVFLMRAIFGITPAFERGAPEQPFLSLNRKLYSPLCFLIGLGFVILVLSLPNWSWRLSEMFR